LLKKVSADPPLANPLAAIAFTGVALGLTSELGTATLIDLGATERE
jgi:hypothetical protein